MAVRSAMLELFAEIDDAEHERLSVTLSDGQITLQVPDGPRFWFSRAAFDSLSDLIGRHDRACGLMQKNSNTT